MNQIKLITSESLQIPNMFFFFVITTHNSNPSICISGEQVLSSERVFDSVSLDREFESVVAKVFLALGKIRHLNFFVDISDIRKVLET